MSAEAKAFLSKTDLRLFAAAIAVAAWLVLLFTGWAVGGFVHALLVVAFFLVPWRAVPRSSRSSRSSRSQAEVVEGPEQAVDKSANGQSD